MRKLMLAAALAVAPTAGFAQVNVGGGLVDVTIQNVDILKNFLNNAQIAALNNVTVPVTVQVPVGVAANVCGVDANVLAQQRKTGDATCTARNGSRALSNSFADQVLNQTR